MTRAWRVLIDDHSQGYPFFRRQTAFVNERAKCMPRGSFACVGSYLFVAGHRATVRRRSWGYIGIAIPPTSDRGESDLDNDEDDERAELFRRQRADSDSGGGGDSGNVNDGNRTDIITTTARTEEIPSPWPIFRTAKSSLTFHTEHSRVRLPLSSCKCCSVQVSPPYTTVVFAHPGRRYVEFSTNLCCVVKRQLLLLSGII